MGNNNLVSIWYLCRRYTSSLSSCIINPSVYIPKRYSSASANERKLILRRVYGNTTAPATAYFSKLSIENLSPIDDLCSHHFKRTNQVIGSCGGWLYLDNMVQESLLWNPSTKHIQCLPRCDVLDPRYDESSLICAGFGFDSKSQDYKIIRFVNLYSVDEDDSFLGGKQQVVLCSLNSGTWKDIPIPIHPAHRFSVSLEACAYVNGRFYWGSLKNDRNHITSFDFAEENFSHMLLPVTGKKFGERHYFRLVDFEGSLGVIVYPRWGTEEKLLELWVLENENEESWTKSSFRISGAERPLGFYGQSLFLEGTNRELLVYDCGAQELKKLGIYDYPYCMQLITYVETTMDPIIGKSRAFHTPAC